MSLLHESHLSAIFLLDWTSITLTSCPFTQCFEFPCHFSHFSRSSFDSDTKNNVRPDYSSFFVHSLKWPYACLLRATADTRSCPNRGVYPLLLHFMKKFARGPRSHCIRVSELARLPFHSCCHHSHVMSSRSWDTSSQSVRTHSSYAGHRFSGLIPSSPLAISDTFALGSDVGPPITRILG
jgi:hypothetical protein